jgi:hypothetical protein
MNRRLALMSVTAAVLGAYVLIGEGGMLSGFWQQPPPESGAAEPVATQDAAATGGAPRQGLKLNPLEGLDAQSFPSIVEQPLFNPGRTPRPAEAPPPVEDPVPAPEPSPDPIAEAPGPVAADYRLLAVSSGPAGRVAALRLNQTGEVLYLREGQDVDQWKVLAVGPRTITIGTPEQNVELVMFETAVDPSEVPAGAEGESPDMAMPPDMFAPPGQMPEGGN